VVTLRLHFYICYIEIIIHSQEISTTMREGLCAFILSFGGHHCKGPFQENLRLGAPDGGGCKEVTPLLEFDSGQVTSKNTKGNSLSTHLEF
jgi:hypothetical protein